MGNADLEHDVNAGSADAPGNAGSPDAPGTAGSPGIPGAPGTPGTQLSRDDPLLPPRRTTSMWPAFSVVALAAFIVIAFSLLGLLSGTSANSRAAKGRVPGTDLVATPAADALAPILEPGQPPTNIVRALTVPTTAHRRATSPGTYETDQYDKAVGLTVPGSEGAVIAFYRHELPRLGWKIQSVGAPSHGSGVQVLAQKAGSDGWYWEVGVTVHPTTFPANSTNGAAGTAAGTSAGSSNGGAGNAAAGATDGTASVPGSSSAAETRGETTRFTMELLQQSDDD